MPEHTIKFDVTDRNTMHLPSNLLREGGRYRVEVRDGDVYVSGNKDGLLYLAEVLVRSAIGGFTETFHVHLPQDSTSGPPTGKGIRPELVIFAGEL